MLSADAYRQMTRRLDDLMVAAERRRQVLQTDFLDLNEASAVMAYLDSKRACYIMDGGYVGAERKVALITGENRLESLEGMAPFYYIRIQPIDLRFSKQPGHRDYLGALMNLGIERRVLGDLLVDEEGALIICLSQIGEFILANLLQVASCQVTTMLIDQAESINIKRHTEEITGTVASLRIDNVIRLAFNLSRNDSMQLIRIGKVFVNSKEITKASLEVTTSQTVAVRGYGKFLIKEIGKTTRKGRQALVLEKYI